MSKPRVVNVMIIGFASAIVVDAKFLSYLYRRTDDLYVYGLKMPKLLHHLAKNADAVCAPLCISLYFSMGFCDGFVFNATICVTFPSITMICARLASG